TGFEAHPGTRATTLMRARWLVLSVLIAGCARQTQDQPYISPEILSEVNRIHAIDNHAHPVRFVSGGEQDREFDALPVDNMEPSSDPVQLRPNDPGTLQAWRMLWNYPYNDMDAAHIREWKQHKERERRQKTDDYPSWILDRVGIEVMLANRVHMGASIQDRKSVV